MPTSNSAATLLAALQLLECLERSKKQIQSESDDLFKDAHVRAIQEARLALKAYASSKP